MTRRIVLFMAILIATFSGPAPVVAKEVDFAPQVWVTPGFVSHHFDRDKGYRDGNPGLGAEVMLQRDHTVLAGTFINSDSERSHYAVYQWRPLHWTVFGLDLGAGIAGGVFDGYPHYRNGGWFPAALPMGSLEGKGFGVNFTVLPNIPNRMHGAFVIQFKLRAW